MPTYIYETTDPTKPIRTFEVKQSVHDDPLRNDPETGEPARRVISAGYSLLIRGKSVGPSVGSVGSHWALISTGLPDIFQQLKERQRLCSGIISWSGKVAAFALQRACSLTCTRFGSTPTISGERNAPRWL